MLTNMINIWRKELMDTIRDRKALTQAILMPLTIGITGQKIGTVVITVEHNN